MADSAAVLDETTIKTFIDDTYYFYAADIPLTQADLPWQPPPAGQPLPPASHHVVIAADTVTVRGTLRYPSRDIRIFARQITFEPDAVIDVSGADPSFDLVGHPTGKDYAPDVLPQQDFSAGAAGASGDSGSAGLPAGNITIVAETMIGSDGMVPRSGTDLLSVADVDDWLATMMQQVHAGLASRISNPQDLSDTPDLLNLGNNLDLILKLTSLRLSGLDAFTSQFDAETHVCTIRFPSLTLAGNFDVAGANNQSLGSGPLQVSAFSVSLEVHLSRVDPATWQVDVLAPVLSGYQPSLQFKILGQDVDVPITGAVLANAITAAISAIVQPMAGARIPAKATGNVRIRACGGRGGRGQSGHPGIQGHSGHCRRERRRSRCVPTGRFGRADGRRRRQGRRRRHVGRWRKRRHDRNQLPPVVRQSRLRIRAHRRRGRCRGHARRRRRGWRWRRRGQLQLVGTGRKLPLGFKGVRSPSLPGVPGPLGAPGDFPSKASASGQAGTVLFNGAPRPNGPVTAHYDYPQIAVHARVEQLLITQHAASIAYLNARTQDDYAKPVMLFAWLCRVTAPVVAKGFAAPNWSGSEIDTAKGLHDFALTMIGRLQAGLDFFGYPKDWAPTFTLNNYLKRIAELIDVGNIVEQQYRTFLAQKDRQDLQLAALAAMRNKLNDDLVNLTAERSSLNDTINAADQTIGDLTERIGMQQNAINADQFVFSQQFRTKIENATGCSFSEVLQFVGAIVTIASGVVDGVGAVAGAAEAGEVAEEAEAAYETASRAIKQIKSVTATIESMQKSIGTIRTMFPANSKSRDVGMLVTDKKKFDKLIDKYVDDPDLPEAAVLKVAVDDYFAMIDARNQAIMTYASLFTQQAKLAAQYAQIVAQIAGIDALTPIVSDPGLPSYLSFMRTAYGNAKTELVSRLYEAHRALAYWTLRDDGFAVNDLDIATLTTTLAGLEDKIDDAKRREGPVQQFTDIAVDITADAVPLGFKSLATTKRLVFSIAPDNPSFQNQYQVLVTGVAVELPGVTAKTGMLTLSLDHSGSEVQVGNARVNGQSTDFTVQFTHARRKVPYTIDFANPDTKRGGRIGDDDFYGLSPFAAWTLDFALPGNEWIDLKSIGRVRLLFSGSYFGPE